MTQPSAPDTPAPGSRSPELPDIPPPSRREHLVLLALALALGALYVGRLIGFVSLNPMNVTWLRADSLASQLGFMFVRQDPVTAFPLLFTDRIGYPLMVSGAYFDLVPLLAIAVLPVSRLLATDFQYIGPLEWASSAALFYLGYRLARGHGGTRILSLSSGVILLTNYVITQRIGSHAALTAQAFLVWIIYEGMRAAREKESCLPRPPPSGRSRKLERACVISVLALGVNPYIAMMTVALSVAYGAELVLLRAVSARTAGATAAAGFGALLLAAWFFGYLGTGESIGIDGFGVYSANLNTFVNPLLFSRFLPWMPVARNEQFEGAAYLGLTGFLLAGFTVFCARRSSLLRAWLRPQLPFFVVGVALFVLALSNRITLGTLTLVEIPLGDLGNRMAAVFRSSGRFVWPLFYLLLCTGLASVAIVVPRRLQGFVGAGLAILQLVELGPFRTSIAEAIPANVEQAEELKDPLWAHLGERYAHLVVLPAWQCAPDLSPGGPAGFGTFGLLAARQRMTINSYYDGRYGDAVLRFHCVRFPAALFRDGPSRDTAYVVSGTFFQWFQANHRDSVQCVEADGFHLCMPLPPPPPG